MLCLGVDPDLHDLAVAAWDDSGPVAAHVVQARRERGVVGGEAVMRMFMALTRPFGSLGIPDAYAVEAQELRRGGAARHARPEDIVHLANVAGMAVMRLAATYPGTPCYFPKPAEWKGSVPKAAMQARLYEELGWGYDLKGTGTACYAIPNQTPAEFARFGAAWKHVGDALLLARWCWEQHCGRPWKRVG